MKFRTTIIMALIFVFGLAAVLLVNKRDEKKAEIKKIEGKLLNIDKDKVKEIKLLPSDIQIVKDGESWKIVSPVETEGDKSSIDGLMNMFDMANVERVVSSDPAEYADFGLVPGYGKMIIVSDSTTDTLYVGDKNPTGSFVFARKSGSADVFVTTTSLQTNVDKKLFDLRNKKVLNFETNDIKELLLNTKKVKLSVSKTGNEWNMTVPGNYKADNAEVNKITSRLNSETVKEFVDEEPVNLQKYGLLNPAVKVELLLGENKAKKTLLIGKADGDKYFAKDDSRNPVFLVDSAFVGIFNKSVFDLRNKNVAEFDQMSANRLELNYSGMTVVCEKDTADNWTVVAPDSGKAQSFKISSIIRQVSGLKVEEFVTDSPGSLSPYGLSRPEVTCKIINNDQLLTELLLGKEINDKIYAKTTDIKSVYLVKKDIMEQLKPKLEDILEVKQQETSIGTENPQNN